MKTMNLEHTSKYTKLSLGILFDLVGSVSFFIPGIGELSDILWAPASAYLMNRMYKGKTGKIASVIAFVEEALPFTDVIPTFTLTWLYTYVFSTQKNSAKTVRVKSNWLLRDHNLKLKNSAGAAEFS